MSEQLAFKPATRKGVKPLIGLVGTSGGGKTMTALLVARGLVGPKGKVGLVDTENERGSIFAELIPGGYEALNLSAPFAPLRYVEAIDIAEQSGVECVVIDSATHEWNGEGGYLDMKNAALFRMAGDDYKKREKCAMAAAAQVKPGNHNRFVQRLLRANMAVILCFRGHHKVRMEKNAENKTEIKEDEFISPIQDSGLIFEMLVAGEVYAREVNGKMEGGFFRCTKHTHPDIPSLLPRDGEQFGIKHGELIARWAANPGAAPEPKAKKATPENLRARILEIGVEGGISAAAMDSFLRNEGLLKETEDLETLDVAGLTVIGTKLKGVIAAASDKMEEEAKW